MGEYKYHLTEELYYFSFPLMPNIDKDISQ